MSAWPGSSEATTLVSVTANANLNKRSSARAGGQSFSHPPGRTSFHLAEGGLRPNSTGLPVDTHEEDGFVLRATQSSQSGHPRDNPLRNSKDGSRPMSRPSAAIQSPYLQPPGGRGSQTCGHRPSSRQQSQQSTLPQHAQQNAQQTFGQSSPTLASAPSSGTSPNMLRRSTNSNNGSGTANGTRIFQAYGAAVPGPRPFQSATAASTPHTSAIPSPKSATSQPQLQQPVPAGLGRPIEQFPPPPPQQQQQQQARAAVTQQQQQAGPRATTALSGARSMQRGTGTVAMGGGFDGIPMTVQQAAGFRPSGSAAGPVGAAGVHHPYHHVGLAVSAAGALALRDSDGVSTSFGYDDIPEEEDESVSPVASNAFSGLTLDQYMQRMVTTPASAAATSGLGVSADSEESAPCSPGNASTRTEEEDSPYSSPAMPSSSSASFGRYADGGGVSSDVIAVRRTAGALSPPNPQASGMPRLSKRGRGSPTARVGTSSGVLVQRVNSGSMLAVAPWTTAATTATSSSSAAAVVVVPVGAVGGRSSVTNPPPAGRGPSCLGGPPARGAVVGPATGTLSVMHDDAHGIGGMGADMSALLDGGSSDDDQLNPSALLDSPRSSRRLSSRASAMAFSNSLDLRPATAAVVSSSSMTRGDPNTPRGIAMAADSGNHHAIIKQVDLGGLSASLFTPNPNSGREASSSPASTANNLAGGSADLLIVSNPSSPDLPPGRPDRRIAASAATAGSTSAASTSMLRTPGPSSGDHAHVGTTYPSSGSGGGSGTSGGGAGTSGGGGLQKVLASPKAPMAAIPPPWGVSAREGAFGNVQAGDGSGGASSLQALAARPLSSRGRPGAVAAVAAGSGGDSVVVSPSAVPTAAAARPGSGVKWAMPQQQVKSETGGGAPVMDLPPEARLLAAEAQGLPRPPTRQVQSARPPGSRGEMELDPSVWQANIAMQLQRPPSRQKPPPEALHLWTPEQQMGMLATGAGLGRPGGGGRPMGGRPQSAAPATYRGTRPTSGPSVKAQGPVGEDMAGTSARPPSRQKPPPLSTLLEHDDFPPPPAGPRRQRPGADQMDVVVSDSSSSSSEEEEDLDL
ncbi:hypothetical protein VaNZ11_003927 [Volvox africanus]|uniref:Uncharacterized protein n=1 Tax=Volvox africanus TaxID=51714 RepID=A0ABQ5RVE0_9CHLO|nr:hypothetical protein VaNZ11_003927 [Volvox africanus]